MQSMSQMERAAFKTLQEKYTGKTISMHTLRLEAKISNTTSQYSFNTLEDTGAKTKTEIRLNKNDILFTTAIGYGICAVDMTATPANSKDSMAEIMTYPSSVVFAAVVGPPAFTPTHLEVFWKATLTLKVGDTEFIPGMETDGFRYVPELLKSASTNYDHYSRMSGFIELPTYYILRGTDQIALNVNVIPFSGLAVENLNANFENRLVLRPRGFLIRGGAKLD